MLTTNAAEISAFLSGANPYLPKDTLMGLFITHAAHHITQFQQLKAGVHMHEADTWRARLCGGGCVKPGIGRPIF
jgi:hypothetical protein